MVAGAQYVGGVPMFVERDVPDAHIHQSYSAFSVSADLGELWGMTELVVYPSDFFL